MMSASRSLAGTRRLPKRLRGLIISRSRPAVHQRLVGRIQRVAQLQGQRQQHPLPVALVRGDQQHRLCRRRARARTGSRFTITHPAAQFLAASGRGLDDFHQHLREAAVVVAHDSAAAAARSSSGKDAREVRAHHAAPRYGNTRQASQPADRANAVHHPPGQRASSRTHHAGRAARSASCRWRLRRVRPPGSRQCAVRIPRAAGRAPSGRRLRDQHAAELAARASARCRRPA